MSDMNTPAKSLSQNYELLDYKCQTTVMDATPSNEMPKAVSQVHGFHEGPRGGKKVAGLEPKPLGPAQTYNDRAWKPKGRKS